MLAQVPFVWLFGPALWYGRLISLLSVAAVALFVGLTLHALTKDRIAAAGWGSDLPRHALRGALVFALAGRLAGAGALLGRAVRRRALAREALERLRLGPASRGGRLYPPDLHPGRAARGLRVARRPGPAPPGPGDGRYSRRRLPAPVRGPEHLYRGRVLPQHRNRQPQRLPLGAGQPQRPRCPPGLSRATARFARFPTAHAAQGEPRVVARRALPASPASPQRCSSARSAPT